MLERAHLSGYIYPQRTASDLYFGARAYLRLLQAFSRGVRSAGTRVPVIGGATAPVGLNDKLRTSPQRFARYLKSKDASRWFDAYSHHPYSTLPAALRTTPPRDRPTTLPSA